MGNKYAKVLTSPILSLALALAFIVGVLFSEVRITSTFMPHRTCLGDSLMILLFVVCDLIIWLSYIVISLCLLYIFFLSKNKINTWLLACFATFIVACGFTHFASVLTMYIPVYRIAGTISIICAIASLTTAALFPFYVSRIVSVVREVQDGASTRE